MTLIFKFTSFQEIPSTTSDEQAWFREHWELFLPKAYGKTVVPRLRDSEYLLLSKPFIGSLSDVCVTWIFIKINLTHVNWAEFKRLNILPSEQRA